MSETTTTFDARPEWHEPFPEPNTIPAGWDTTSMSETAPVVEPTEVETGD